MRCSKFALKMVVTSLLSWGLVACSSEGSSLDLGKPADLASPADLTPAVVKGVYTMSNELGNNQIFAYSRMTDGSLIPLNSFSTGGGGTGAALGNQGGLVFDPTQNLFFAVNAGDNTISMLALKSDGTLTMLAQALSNGIRPISITVSGSIVYVLNAGNGGIAANIQGFQISGQSLTQIANSSKPLSTALPGPAQIQFTQNGTVLVVTEKTTGKIDTFTVASGIATGPNVQTSNGMTPFGFAFSANQKLIVSEAVNGTANAGTASSYSVASNGMLTSVSSKVASGQTSPCWVAVANNTAYVANAMTNNITAYTVATDGTLSLVGSGNSGTTGMGPIDLDATDGNEFLYVLNSKDHSFSIFAINADGSLTKKTDYAGLPANAAGIVAR